MHRLKISGREQNFRCGSYSGDSSDRKGPRLKAHPTDEIQAGSREKYDGFRRKRGTVSLEIMTEYRKREIVLRFGGVV